MPALAGLLSALSVLLLVGAVSARRDPLSVALVLRSADPGKRRSVAALPRRLGTSPMLRRLVRADRLRERLRAAGWKVSVDELIGTKVVAGFAGVATVGVLAPGLAPLALLVGAGAFLAPDLVVSRAARSRLRKADAEIPEFLDLLAASSSAGLAAPAAIARASTGLRGPLADELGSASAAVGIGGRWREELAGIGERLRLPDLRMVVAAITRTESLGSSLADAMRGLAEDVRESRRSRAAERARTAPVKMLFPLVCMILPAFLLLTVVPVLIATLRSLR